MKLYAFHCGGDKVDLALFDPFHPDVGTKIDIPFFFYLVAHPAGNVLFDGGCHKGLITDPCGRLGDIPDAYSLNLKEGDDVVSQIARISMNPEHIGHVALSHLHYDHSGAIEFFPSATFYVQRTELRFAYWPASYQATMYARPDFEHPVQWRECSGWTDVFGDGTIVLFPTPGHTPGHQSMLVKLEHRNIILVGDAAYLPRNIELGVLPAIVWSPDAMVDSWQLIEQVRRDHDAELIFTHDPDWARKTRVAPDMWYE